MELDTKSLVLVLSISNALMGCTLLWVFRGSKEEGIDLWIASLFMKAVATFVLLFPLTLPSPVFAYAVPMALTGAYTLNYLALCIFLGFKRNAWLAYGPLVAAAVILVFVGQLPFYSVVGADLIRAFLIGVVISLLMRDDKWRRDRAKDLVLVGFLLGLMVFGGRVIANILDAASFESFNRSNSGRSVTFLMSFTVSILTSFGLVLMYRNRAIGKLLASEDSLRTFKAIVDSTDDAIISKTLTGIITSWNQGAARLFGYRAEEAIGKPMQMLIPADRSNEETEILARITRGERVDHLETVRLHKDGRMIDISMTISPILNSGGKVMGASKIARDITERKHLEAQIKQMAHYDVLTNLPNRRLLNDRLSQAMAITKRTGRHGALMLLDLDNFKPLNDTYGHDVGDLLLIQVAERLTDCVREVDTVARFGGDEFVVLLNDLTEDRVESTEKARGIAEKIRATLAEPYWIDTKHKAASDTLIEHCCTASIGVLVFSSPEGDPADLLKRADAAMYQAKEAGRNEIRFYGLTK